MKKSFKYYVLSWTAIFCLFNLLVFIIPAWPSIKKYTPSFWIGWSITIAIFFGQLTYAWKVFKNKTSKKTFYNMSLFTISYIGLIALFIIALTFMIVTPLPYWISPIACFIVLITNIILIEKAKIAVDTVESIDEKIEKATSFIYEMRQESETLIVQAKDENTKNNCKKIRDAFKFSDPMSNEKLESIESEIKTCFEKLKKAIIENNKDTITSESEKILILISERSNKCQTNKHINM